MSDGTPVLRMTAFAADPAGGNPAGVVLDARSLPDAQMQQIAADVGYAETAFIVKLPTPSEPTRYVMRYFSPTAEVPFCGHATVATAVALADRGAGEEFVFETPAGDLVINTTRTAAGTIASFTSIEPQVDPIENTVRRDLMALLGINDTDLDPAYPPRLSTAGNTHPIIVLWDRSTFDTFTFEPAAMRRLMDEQGWKGTVTILHARSGAEFEARNPFPVGSMDEDPATGSAAAAVGGYLRALGLVESPARVTIHQGRHVGRPSVLTVDIPATGGIVVSGTATVIA